MSDGKRATRTVVRSSVAFLDLNVANIDIAARSLKPTPPDLAPPGSRGPSRARRILGQIECSGK
jgi:hypothetical protein